MSVSRRQFIRRLSEWCLALGLLKVNPGFGEAASTKLGLLEKGLGPLEKGLGPLPTRPLGRTGHQVTLLSLGGEGILRSSSKMKTAVPVIRRALELGVNYFDTAPAYQQSQDYLGEGLQGQRDRIFLASKTHDRSRDGSLQLLENSLRRLRTDHLDLWQLHDLRDSRDLERIFGNNGALQAMEEAKEQGMVRFVGVTGHADPQILMEAIRRYPFDTALVAINAADPVRSSFIKEFLPMASEQEMGVIAMKVMAQGALLADPVRLSPAEAIGYVLSQRTSTALIGCSTPNEVELNVAAAVQFQQLLPQRLSELEERVRPWERRYTSYKQV